MKGAMFRKHAHSNRQTGTTTHPWRVLGLGLILALTTLRASTSADFETLHKQALDGDGIAQWQLAQIYEEGVGVGRDRAKAMVWMHSAAEGGVADAQYALAEKYFVGDLGLEKNMSQATGWLRKAAIQGHIPASYRLGEIYFNGFGVEQDYTMAAAAMKRPALANYLDARVFLGFMSFTGQGMAQDKEKGVEMLREAANLGQERALILLWQAYAVGDVHPVDTHELQRWLAAGIKDGDLRAKERLGLALFLGQGLREDRKVARPLLLEVAEKGSVPAATALAQDIGERLSGPQSDKLIEVERVELILEYNRMVHLVAVSGGLTGIETYIRAITQLTPINELVRPNAAGRLSMGDDLIEALAWGRIYQEQGGQDDGILQWATAGEKWLQGHAAAVDRVAMREKKLRELQSRAATFPR